MKTFTENMESTMMQGMFVQKTLRVQDRSVN